MTQVEVFWAGQCPTPWGLCGASVGPRGWESAQGPSGCLHTPSANRHVQGARGQGDDCVNICGCHLCLGLPLSLSNENLRWGQGQQGLRHYSPTGSFIPQICIDFLLCARPQGAWSQNGTDETVFKKRAQALRGRRAHVPDFILHVILPQEAPHVSCPPHCPTGVPLVVLPGLQRKVKVT